MDIKIEQLQMSDARDLYEFELTNREYFEGMVPSRGDEFYHIDTFTKRLSSLLSEQAQGFSYFYLIKNHQGLILGRINIVDIDQSQSLGHIGYRIGKEYTGKRMAQKALQLLIELTKNLGVKQLSAKTTSNNIASQKVLKKNGFKQVSTIREEVVMKGNSLEFIHFMKFI